MTGIELGIAAAQIVDAVRRSSGTPGCDCPKCLRAPVRAGRKLVAHQRWIVAHVVHELGADWDIPLSTAIVKLIAFQQCAADGAKETS